MTLDPKTLFFFAAMVSVTACSGGGKSQATGGAEGGAGTGGQTGDDGGANDGGNGFSRAGLLGAFGACALSTARDFLARASELETATAALAAQPDAGTRDAARAAFQQAYFAWQVAEPMQFGPASPSADPVDGASIPGGQDLRDQIYAWSLYVSRCAIEEQIVARGYESPTFSTSSRINQRGLYAIEYLLFYEGTETECPASSAIVATGTWSALSTDVRNERKRAYAAAAAADVRRRAAALVDAWEPSKGNFLSTLQTAGSGSSAYPQQQDALNAVSNAIFYVESDVKDMKIMLPLGLRDCTLPMVLCSEQETRFAKWSMVNVRANLVGFRRIFEGCGTDGEGLGFDDLIEAVGAEPLASGFRQHTAAAQAAADAIEEQDVQVAVVADRTSVVALYNELKAIADLLKTDFLTLFDFKIPKKVEGDND